MLANDWSYFAAHPRFSYLHTALNEIEQTWVTQLERASPPGSSAPTSTPGSPTAC